MTDLELLFVVLVVIYLWECACWIPRGSFAFLTSTGRNWRSAPGSASLGNQRGGFVFAMPLPPMGSVLIANPLPLSISVDAVLAFVSTNIDPGGRPRHTGNLARFDQIKAIEANGSKLWIDGTLFLKATSAQHAQWLADRLNVIRKAKRSARESKISELFNETLDSGKVESTWSEFTKETRLIRYLTNSVFCYLFLVAPLVIYHFGLHGSWLELLIGLFVLTTATAVLFRQIHKKFYPKAEDDRFTHFLITMLSPATTPRAHDALSRRLFERYHPLALAKVLCAKEDFRILAQRVLLDIRHPALPLIPSSDQLLRQTEEQSRELWQTSVQRFLERSGLHVDELVTAPAKSDASMQAYCPRCRAQFGRESDGCADCGGVALVSFVETAVAR